VRCRALALAPTGASWAAGTTEGLLLYSLDAGAVFDPTDLAEDVTPAGVAAALAAGAPLRGALLALRLRDGGLLRHALLSTRPDQARAAPLAPPARERAPGPHRIPYPRCSRVKVVGPSSLRVRGACACPLPRWALRRGRARAFLALGVIAPFKVPGMATSPERPRRKPPVAHTRGLQRPCEGLARSSGSRRRTGGRRGARPAGDGARAGRGRARGAAGQQRAPGIPASLGARAVRRTGRRHPGAAAHRCAAPLASPRPRRCSPRP
jgi:hypothetical protein